MKNFYQNLNMNVLISVYFTNPEKRLTLKKGDCLMRQGGKNNRLYLVLEGELSGQVKGPEDSSLELFRVAPGMFAGVHSFFSRSYISSTTITALKNSLVAYIDQHQQAYESEQSESLFEQFMPVVVGDLAYRQQLAHKMSVEKQQALKQVIESEKLASLGQMAAGIAHELNNAAAVLQRNTHWLSEQLAGMFSQDHPRVYPFYESGRSKGRSLSTREIRHRRKELQKRYRLSDDVYRIVSETEVPDSMLPESEADLAENAVNMNRFWEIGATLHGMQLAADHAAHVARSVKTLGAPSSARQPDQDVPETIRQALTLLHHPLRQVSVSTHLAPVPGITANKGELVQIWVNLIRNACESLKQSRAETRQIDILVEASRTFLTVRIQDNGPGIAPELLPTIFQPNVTTKVDGLSFGLGLGLSIVQRLVESYGGSITAESSKTHTVFQVRFPLKVI
ncbi:MAG: ATP-binding protein [Calditrichia bacterium]